MGSSSNLLYKLLEIEVKSATLADGEDGSSFYVKISLAGNNFYRKVLLTKPSPLKNDTVSWAQRFIVSVPESFISDERSSVYLTLIKERTLVSDEAVGQASCNVRKMFPVRDCLNYDGGEGWGTEYKEPEIQEQEIFELRAVVDGAPVIDSGEYLFSPRTEVAKMDFSVCTWRRFYPYELNLRGRLEKKFPIIDRAKKLGKFTVTWPPATESVPLYACSYFKMFKEVSLAMEFEELKDMVQLQLQRQRQRRSLAAATVENEGKPASKRFWFF